MHVVMEETPAVIDLRQAHQERKLRFISFAQHVEVFTRQIWTGEEGGKRLLQRLRVAMATVQNTANRYSDTNINLTEIAGTIRALQAVTAELLLLDPALEWLAGNVQRSCNTFLHVLDEKMPKRPLPPQDPSEINPLRMKLLDMIDELNAKLLCLGDLAHGGMKERRPAVAKAFALRSAVQQDVTSDLSDAESLMVMVRAVQAAVNGLASLPSRVTHEPGFMARAVPAINQQCERILAVLASAVPKVRQRGSLSIKP